MGELTPVIVFLAALLAVIRARRDLSKRTWFWAVIVLVLALHVPLIFIIRWPPNFWAYRMRMLPLGVADAFIILGAVRLVEKFILKAPPPQESGR